MSSLMSLTRAASRKHAHRGVLLNSDQYSINQDQYTRRRHNFVLMLCMVPGGGCHHLLQMLEGFLSM
ncbi:hypothetical protein OIU84_029424 [Salix udensis]|uniref:Uncharacterized protein n=1 Tax=Salix udensis TaxID=889485 RepID=A0AAD6K9S9_9ROSI|nr:hypothetical protein OIU84_029424 [Salix udensis]